jgi:hypothetical protein
MCKELMCALNICLRNWCMRWAYMLETGVRFKHMCQELMRALNACMKFEKVPSKHADHTSQELMRTLSVCIRNWYVHWSYTSGTDVYPEHMHQFLTHLLSIGVKFQIWKGPFNTYWAYPKVTDTSTECTLQELMCALSVRIRNWCVHSSCASDIKWCLALPKN